MKVDIEILGSKATFIDPSGRNHPIEEGQGRIWKRWMRTGAQIARDQYRWMHDGKASCWPVGFQKLLFVFPAPTRTDTDCAFHFCFAIFCIPYVRSWSYFISIVSFIDCGLRFYAFKKVRFLGCSCPSLAPWQKIHWHNSLWTDQASGRASHVAHPQTNIRGFRTKLTKVIRSNYGMNAKPAG